MILVDPIEAVHSPKIFLVCDRSDTAPVWEYVLRERGLIITLETSPQKAIEHWTVETADLTAIDLDVPHQERMELTRKLRAASVAPILLLLPAHHETEILEAYAAGVDEVIIKPVSPAIFLAKIQAWGRRSWTVPLNGLSLVKAGKYRLQPARRCMIDSEGVEIKLTTLEFRLLHLLMSRPGHIFEAENIVESIWGGYENGDQVLLKNVVYRLRRKIETDPSHPVLLQTWPGGYSFQE
jgi:two-component system OmpR family response regulator